MHSDDKNERRLKRETSDSPRRGTKIYWRVGVLTLSFWLNCRPISHGPKKETTANGILKAGPLSYNICLTIKIIIWALSQPSNNSFNN